MPAMLIQGEYEREVVGLSELQDVLERLETDVLMDDHARERALREAAQSLDEAGAGADAATVRALALVFSFVCCGDKLEGQRFKPRLIGSDGQHYPSMAQVTPEVVAVVEQQADATANPALKARYCDLLWEVGENHTRARQAVDAYLEFSQVALDAHLAEGHIGAAIAFIDALARALDLAVSLSDGERIAQARDEHLAVIRTLVERERPRWTIELTETLVECGKIRDGLPYDELGDLTERALALHRAQSPDNFALAHRYLAILEQEAKARGDAEGVRSCQARVGELLEQQANCSIDRNPASHAVASMFFLQAAKAYQMAGDRRACVDRCLRLAERSTTASRSEMLCTPVRVGMGQEEWEGLHRFICERADKLGIGVLCETDPFLPCGVPFRENAETALANYPLANLFTPVTINGDRVVAVANTEEERLRQQVVQDRSLYLQMFSATFVRWAVEHLSETAALNVDIMLECIGRCDLLRPWRLELLRPALERYLAEDYISAIHILAPQLEGILRDVLAALECPTIKQSGDGTTEAKLLGDLLADQTLQQALAVIGDDFVSVLKALLTEKVGLNVRNEVCHGLAEPGMFSQTVADLLVLALFQVTDCRLGTEPHKEGLPI